MRIAIVQNHLGLDGRSKTVAEIVRLLNEQQLEPELVTFSDEKDEALFRANTAAALRFQRVRIGRPPLLVGDLLQETVLPWLLRRRLRSYDAIIASNTAVYGYPAAVPLLRIVCFPLEQVPAYEARYCSPALRVYGAACLTLLRLARLLDRGPALRGVWTANSAFTRGVMSTTYGLSPDGITLLYPPNDTHPSVLDTERSGVVSLGGFHPDKRQLQQIELARSLPEVPFYLIGSVRSQRYFRLCEAAARTAGNVHLIANAPWPEVQRLLSTAKVFLHSKRNEHFGMSTVEAIAAGCLPVVHDSGGQREVVPLPALRFDSEAAAGAIIRTAMAGELDDHLSQLQAQIQQFSREAFRSRFRWLLAEMLPTSEAARAA